MMYAQYHQNTLSTEAKMSSLLIFVLKTKSKIGIFKNKVWGSVLRTVLLAIGNIHDLKI